MITVTGLAIMIVSGSVIMLTSSKRFELPPDLRHCYATFSENIKLEEGETIDTYCLHEFLWKKDVVPWHEFHVSQKDFDTTKSLIKSFLNRHQPLKRTKRQIYTGTHEQTQGSSGGRRGSRGDRRRSRGGRRRIRPRRPGRRRNRWWLPPPTRDPYPHWPTRPTPPTRPPTVWPPWPTRSTRPPTVWPPWPTRSTRPPTIWPPWPTRSTRPPTVWPPWPTRSTRPPTVWPPWPTTSATPPTIWPPWSTPSTTPPTIWPPWSTPSSPTPTLPTTTPPTPTPSTPNPVSTPATGFRMRREYRTLTEQQRQTFHRTVNILKNNGIYDTFASLHSGIVVTSAHQGPNFLGWHRAYLALFEEALRRINNQVFLPFWDCSMDASMERPETSEIWTPDFLGTPNGVVRTGPCANWNTSTGPLIRSVPGRGVTLLSKAQKDRVLSLCRVENITFPSAENRNNLELIHGATHNWVGGQMSGLNTAGYDLVFFMYHCFIDYIWNEFRKRQDSQDCGVNPEDYPSVAGNHNANRLMDGFGDLRPPPRPPYRNRDGYARYWNTLWFDYEDSPTCSASVPSCGTNNLICNRSTWECQPRSMPQASMAIAAARISPEARQQQQREQQIMASVEARIGERFPTL